MYCPQLKYPGTHIEDPDPDQALTIQMVVHGLESSLVDTAVSLDLFDASAAELEADLLKRTEPVGFSTGLHNRPFIC